MQTVEIDMNLECPKDDFIENAMLHPQIHLTPNPLHPLPVPGFSVIRRGQIRRTNCYMLKRCGWIACKAVGYTSLGLMIFFFFMTIGMVYVNESMIDDLWVAYDRVLIREELDNNDIMALQKDLEFMTFKVQILEDYLRQQSEGADAFFSSKFHQNIGGGEEEVEEEEEGYEEEQENDDVMSSNDE